MPNYSELYSLPSASALSLPHYNSGTINYLSYTKPLSRYPGVYKPHLSTISEISSPYRRLNQPKLTYSKDISSRSLRPIKEINTADIDVSVNKYKKYEKKSPRLKSIDTATYSHEHPKEIKESTPNQAIKRERPTIRIHTVHADTVKQEIGALRTWRDNFAPSELGNEVKPRKKTTGEILKEKFLIRSRSKENIAGTVDSRKKNVVKRTSSFRDICTAITSESITDNLNPGQPEEVKRRQSKQLSSEDLLNEIRRVSTDLSRDDINLLNTILSNQEDTSDDSSDESVASVDLTADIPLSETVGEKSANNLIKAKSDAKVGKSSNEIDLAKSKSVPTVLDSRKQAPVSLSIESNETKGREKTLEEIVDETNNFETQDNLKTNEISSPEENSSSTTSKTIEDTMRFQVKKLQLPERIKTFQDAPIKRGKNTPEVKPVICFSSSEKPKQSNEMSDNLRTVESANDKNSLVPTIKDISNVEIQEIKYKAKPVITASVDDINIATKTLIAVVNHVEVEKPSKIDKKLKANITVNVEQTNKEDLKTKNLTKSTIKQGSVSYPQTQKCVENILIPKHDSTQKVESIEELTPIKKVKKNATKPHSLDVVPENSVIVQAIKAESDQQNKVIDAMMQNVTENLENGNNDQINDEIKITSKASLLKKPSKDDPDLQVFVTPDTQPVPEPPEEKTDVFVPLQSNRLTQWMHPWAKPEQFDECPVEIFARPKVIRGRHYPRPRKRNTNVPAPVATTVVDNESNGSDSDDNSSSEDTSASLRSNDSGFGSTIPEKINSHQQEKINEENELSGGQMLSDIFVPTESGKIIRPATTVPRFRKYCVDDFDFLKVLGKGSFGKVLLSKLKETDYYYAVKCLKKDVIVEDNDVECTLIERKVLALGTKHPFLCHLLCTFQTESHLFFVMEYLNGGDLMFHITTDGSFSEDQVRFYSAEIISGLQFLHSKGIIYRDLKLDNILLDFDGHARLADFGMCQLQIFLDRMAESFCGTPDYMAPEIIKGLHYNQAVDWWSFGVLLYEMFLGQSPFSGCDEDELFWSICNEKPVFPKHLSTYAVEILTSLLEKDQAKRLGTRFSPHGSIRDHNFYQKLDWKALEARQVEPPFKPNLNHPLDTQYFDTHFTKEAVKLSPTGVQILETIDQSQFQGFSYTNPNATDK